ncbi:hypothetical protein ACFSGX_14100 [Sphingomonas arantia]|uniref:Uncharacterized protein n=1 Tax=Sphingomonas arantia TaxID=1460676 RepID=A0ABW4TZ00_9SPHN
MTALARLQAMPDWPARMTAEVAAMYMGVSISTFRTRYGNRGVKDGSNVLWARRQLDAIIDAQFGLGPPSHVHASDAGPRDDTWDDV